MIHRELSKIGPSNLSVDLTFPQVPQEGEEISVLSKGFASLMSLGKTEVHDQLKILQAENKLLREQNVRIRMI